MATRACVVPIFNYHLVVKRQCCLFLFFTLQGMNPLTVFSFVVYIIGSLTTIGMLFDNSPYACIFELLRCMLLVTVIQRTNFIDMKDNLLIGTEVFFVLSGLFWFLQCIKVVQISKETKMH